MKYTFLLFTLFCSWQQSRAANADTLQLSGYTWKLLQQVYTSRDASGTAIHKIKGQAGDYIRFEKNGKAIVRYKGNCDTLDYSITEGNFIHLGNEAAYKIAITAPGRISLSQRTDENTDGYNSISLELKR